MNVPCRSFPKTNLVLVFLGHARLHPSPESPQMTTREICCVCGGGYANCEVEEGACDFWKRWV